MGVFPDGAANYGPGWHGGRRETPHGEIADRVRAGVSRRDSPAGRVEQAAQSYIGLFRQARRRRASRLCMYAKEVGATASICRVGVSICSISEGSYSKLPRPNP